MNDEIARQVKFISGLSPHNLWRGEDTLKELVARREREAVKSFAERLKTYNGSFIEGALRHNHYVHHSIIDTELERFNQPEASKE